MRTLTTTSTALALVLGLGAAAIGASPAAAGSVATPDRAFSVADRNGDGVVDRREWALRDARLTPWEERFGPQHHSRHRSALSLSAYFGGDPTFGAADRSRDGVVDRQEFLAHVAAIRDAAAPARTARAAAPERRFGGIDRNGDGVITRDEWALRNARLTPWEEMFGPHHHSPHRAAISLSTYLAGDPVFDALDRDNDGRLSRAEFLGYADQIAEDRTGVEIDWRSDWEKLFGPHHSSPRRGQG